VAQDDSVFTSINLCLIPMRDGPESKKSFKSINPNQKREKLVNRKNKFGLISLVNLISALFLAVIKYNVLTMLLLEDNLLIFCLILLDDLNKT
jgi:hypothetical protein